MKKIFLFLVAIVFVLGSYGFSEARKYKMVCKTSVWKNKKVFTAGKLLNKKTLPRLFDDKYNFSR